VRRDFGSPWARARFSIRTCYRGEMRQNGVAHLDKRTLSYLWRRFRANMRQTRSPILCNLSNRYLIYEEGVMDTRGLEKPIIVAAIYLLFFCFSAGIAFILFKYIPGSEATAEGSIGDLSIKASGAFAGFIISFIVLHQAYTKIIMPKRLAITGNILDEEQCCPRRDCRRRWCRSPQNHGRQRLVHYRGR
jgi:hypothetical protein